MSASKHRVYFVAPDRSTHGSVVIQDGSGETNGVTVAQAIAALRAYAAEHGLAEE